MANGLYTNAELVDTLIKDLNSLVKDMTSGQYVQFCVRVTGMAQKLINLKEGINADLKSKDDKIEDLKRMLKEKGTDVDQAISNEKDGVTDGK